MTRTNRPSRRRPRTRAAGSARVIALAQFMLILDLTVVNVALPDLGTDLDLSRTAFTWAVSAYGLVFGGLLLLGGRGTGGRTQPGDASKGTRCTRQAA